MIQDPYFSTDRNVDRLIEQYKKYGSLVVAFDFDDTIYDYHKNGFDYPKVVTLLKECLAMGFTLIMFTTTESVSDLKANAEYCRSLGINEFYINSGPIMPKAIKPFFNVYLDDKAGLMQAYDILSQTIKIIKEHGELNG